jgi:hypothetical protein
VKLSDILPRLGPVIGFSSLLGAPGSVSSRQELNPTLEQAQAQLDKVLTAQRNCQSDYAYWGYEGQKAYWRCLVDLCKAAEITGPDNLPDVALPKLEGQIVMSACGNMESFGRAVLAAAKATA